MSFTQCWLLASMVIGSPVPLSAGTSDRPIAVSEPIHAPGARSLVIVLRGSGTIRAVRTRGNGKRGFDFDLQWGPRPQDGQPFEGKLVLDDAGAGSPTKVQVTRGYVRVTGDIADLALECGGDAEEGAAKQGASVGQWR